MPTPKDAAVKMIQEASDALLRTTVAMPEDKTTWKPLDEGRTALDQVVECGVINNWSAQVLGEFKIPPMDLEIFQRTLAEFDSMEKAQSHLRSSAENLVAVIREFPEDRLDETIQLPFFGGMEKTYYEVMLLAHWNMIYHCGQINYIQTLYGDRQMH